MHNHLAPFHAKAPTPFGSHVTDILMARGLIRSPRTVDAAAFLLQPAQRVAHQLQAAFAPASYNISDGAKALHHHATRFSPTPPESVQQTLDAIADFDEAKKDTTFADVASSALRQHFLAMTAALNVSGKWAMSFNPDATKVLMASFRPDPTLAIPFLHWTHTMRGDDKIPTIFSRDSLTAWDPDIHPTDSIALCATENLIAAHRELGQAKSSLLYADIQDPERVTGIALHKGQSRQEYPGTTMRGTTLHAILSQRKATRSMSAQIAPLIDSGLLLHFLYHNHTPQKRPPSYHRTFSRLARGWLTARGFTSAQRATLQYLAKIDHGASIGRPIFDIYASAPYTTGFAPQRDIEPTPLPQLVAAGAA